MFPGVPAGFIVFDLPLATAGFHPAAGDPS
jgi:hypothetical protein